MDEFQRILIEGGVSSYIFNEYEQKDIQKHGDICLFKSGEFIFRESEIGKTVFIIKSGSVQIFKNVRDSIDEIISIRGKGEIFGESALFEDSYRFTSAIALEDVEAIRFKKTSFFELLNEKPYIALKIMGYQSTKMRDSDTFRIKILEKNHEQIQRTINELKEAQDELMRRERLAAVGGFASKIVHDIKGTITPLKLYSENLHHLDSEALSMGMTAIKHSISRIMRMCEELLEYIKGNPVELQLKRQRIDGFVKREIDYVKDIFDRNNIKIKTNYLFNGYIVIDEERMGRVMQNLFMNAKDAMPDGGFLEVNTLKDKGFAIVQVIDSGFGINEDLLKKLFTPFMTEGKRRGTGLGLTISRKIIEEHNGRIEVLSEIGKGTMFSLYIPRK